MIKLSDIKTGKKVKIIDFTDNLTRCHTARFGLSTGHIICCKAKIGPIIISKDHQIIAIGKNLSGKILVQEI